MYSCVFGGEFIDLVGFFGCHCLTPVSPFILYEVKAAQKHSPAVRTLSTQRQFAARI